MSFVHLHNHTQYSILDGACMVKDIIRSAKKYEMPAVAITDHGNLFGLVDFHKTAKRNKIKPILGIETYVVDHDFEHEQSKEDRRYHLIILVKNRVGYQNLIKISSRAYLSGFYRKPRINKSYLVSHKEGLLILSACVQGELCQKAINQDEDGLYSSLNFYKENFGDDFYIEIQKHDIPSETQAMNRLIKLGKETDTKLVLTNDCHYIKKEDYQSHDLLLCIQTGSKLEDEDRMRYNTNQLYFKSSSEMAELFPEIPSATANTLEITDKIDFNLKKVYNSYLLPQATIPDDGDKKEYLEKLVWREFPKKYKNPTKGIKDRIKQEINIISKMGYEGYFLIVKDLVDRAGEMDIPVGPGRGSAAGSIVSYLLGITQIDPLQYGLLFERFLDQQRIGMPDIDIDFCAKGRDKIIGYLIEKYGRDCVTQIVTYSKLGAKAAIKDVARVLGISHEVANDITKLISNEPGVTLKRALRENPMFKEKMLSKEIYQKVLKNSLFVEGLIRQTSVHACGTLITPSNIQQYVPLATTRATKKGKPVILSQYEGVWLDDLKMLKLDILGLKTLTLIKETVELIKKSQNIDVKIDNIPLNDKKSYELFADGNTDGIFQFESVGMKKYLVKLEPNCFEDIIAMTSLYRPGPMQYIDTFIARKHKKLKVKYAHPLMEKVLSETYGITVYQEQLMRLSQEIGGFSGSEADTLRKAMGKKKKRLMDKLKVKFIDGAKERGLDSYAIESIWQDWEKFAKYAFNKSHSTAYAMLSYKTAYLKSHFPVEFMATLLSLEENPAKIPYFIDECKLMNIEVISPNINICEKEFSVEGKKILFGLKGIKNVGSAAIESIVGARKKYGKFNDIFEFSKNINLMFVNKGVFEALIFSGAMDDLVGNRAEKILAIESILEYGNSAQKDMLSSQISIFDTYEEKSKDSYKPSLSKHKDYEILQKVEFEKKYLGFYLSGHPLSEYKLFFDLFCNITTKELIEEEKEIPEIVKIGGVVTKVSRKTSRSKNPYAIVTMEDFYGKYEILLFGRDYDNYAKNMESGKRFFLKGVQSSFSEDEKMLRLIPKVLFDIDEQKGRFFGDIFIELDESIVSNKFINNILDLSEDNGNFKLHLFVKSQSFGLISIKSNNKKILLNDRTKEFLKKAPIDNYYIELDFG